MTGGRTLTGAELTHAPLVTVRPQSHGRCVIHTFLKRSPVGRTLLTRTAQTTHPTGGSPAGSMESQASTSG